ncbi:MAG TPA: 2-oxoglutarate and iron-dependent oxygenase domain-containing protein [Stellaceae bacterium]|nr:2-oxoglutarate and iron-dependent oxygenase domain-containing protein [Stellaceae bacterium]
MGERHGGLDSRSDMTIPVIDVGPYLAGAPRALEATAQAIGAAAESLGFYFIGNHGISASLIDRVFAETQRFHELPLEKKLAVQAIGKVIGYLPLGGQTQNTSIYAKSTYPDASASFYIKREFARDHPDRLAKKPWVADNRWPSDLLGFRETCLDYYDAMTELGHKMLTVHAVALDLPPDTLNAHEAFQPSGSTLRLLHYPPRDPAKDGQFGIGPHTDYGYCTYLAQAKKPGLEILTRAGEWIEAPALEGHFLVNNADMCRRWTNDRWRSAPHRVINKTGDVRYSIPFFFGPRADVKLACLPSCQSADNPPKYPPMSFGEYLAELEPKNYVLATAAS